MVSVLAFYQELDRKVAVLKNNKSYIIENVQLKGLIKQLRSADSLSDVEARLVSRTQDKKPLSVNSEYFVAARFFDDAKLSTVIQCLRQSNQNLLRRIEENGGG